MSEFDFDSLLPEMEPEVPEVIRVDSPCPDCGCYEIYTDSSECCECGYDGSREDDEDDEDNEPDDRFADAEWLASAGRGTDEDYGCTHDVDDFS